MPRPKVTSKIRMLTTLLQEFTHSTKVKNKNEKYEVTSKYITAKISPWSHLIMLIAWNSKILMYQGKK